MACPDRAGVDRPIIFSAPMVRALLDGHKTMTRRLAWRDVEVHGYRAPEHAPSPWQRVKSGDRLWVRENFQTAFTLDKKAMEEIARDALNAGYRRPWAPIKYVADGATDNWTSTDWGSFGKGRPSIFMPRWASRLTLIVTATKIEPLQDLTYEDAAAEGVSADGGAGLTGAFMALWEKLHGPDAWNDNPDVVALTFTVELRNIDSVAASAASSLQSIPERV